MERDAGPRDGWTVLIGRSVMLAGVVSLLLAGIASAAPRRVVSANVASDEILLAIAPERLVAISAIAGDPEVSNAVAEAVKVPVRVKADVEQILALKPDLVAIGAQSVHVASQLESLGIQVVRIQGFESIAWVERLIRTLGDAASAQDRAQALVTRMHGRLAAVRDRVAGRPRPRVMSYSPNGGTAGQRTLFDELIRAAGGENVAAELGVSGFKRVSLERVLTADPDVILLRTWRRWAPGFPDELMQNPALRGMRAISTGRVHQLPGRLMVAASHHVAETVEALASVLHPGQVEWHPR